MEWIDVNQKYPEMRGNTSALVLIAKPLRSRPKRLVTSVGYLQKFGIEETIWVDALSRVPDIPTVRYWMPLPEPPEGDGGADAGGRLGRERGSAI